MTNIDATGNYVRVNKTQHGWTWSIQVGSTRNTIDQLRIAKEAALQLDAELREALIPSPDPADF